MSFADSGMRWSFRSALEKINWPHLSAPHFSVLSFFSIKKHCKEDGKKKAEK